MKLIDLVKVLYGYNEIELYNSNNEYLGFYYDYNNIKKEYQNQKILSIWVNDHGQLEIYIEKS